MENTSFFVGFSLNQKCHSSCNSTRNVCVSQNVCVLEISFWNRISYRNVFHKFFQNIIHKYFSERFSEIHFKNMSLIRMLRNYFHYVFYYVFYYNVQKCSEIITSFGKIFQHVFHCSSSVRITFRNLFQEYEFDYDVYRNVFTFSLSEINFWKIHSFSVWEMSSPKAGRIGPAVVRNVQKCLPLSPWERFFFHWFCQNDFQKFISGIWISWGLL